MSYALGMQLAPDAVRVATMSDASSYDGPFDVYPPVLYCEGTSTWVGADAVAHGAARPQALVQDVVGQFTVDRLFLTSGRMLTTDDALRELMGGVVATLTGVRQAPPRAVTVSCPATWQPDTQARVAAIAHGLRLASPRVVAGEDCYAAAHDAFTRLPQHQAVPLSAAPDVPAFESSFRRPAPVTAPAPVVTPHTTEIGSSRRAIIASAVAVVALVVILVFILLRNGNEPTPAPPSSSTPAGVVVVDVPLFLPPR